MIMILSVDTGRSGCFFNFALTSDLPNVLDFFKLRQGLGMCSSSSGLGLMILLSFFVSRSGVYSVTKKVSYEQGLLCFSFMTLHLCA